MFFLLLELYCLCTSSDSLFLIASDDVDPMASYFDHSLVTNYAMRASGSAASEFHLDLGS